MRASVKSKMCGGALVALCLVVTLGYLAIQTRAAQGVTFAVAVSEMNLTAGTRTKVSFKLLNNSTRDVMGLDAKLTVGTSPLVIATDNWWHFYSVGSNQTVSFSTDIFAPPLSIGSTYSATLSLAYNISSTHRLSEDHVLGFMVYGKVEVTAYGVAVDPTPVAPGGNVTISASLLNKGNVAALYVNVTMRGYPLSPRPESTTYIGTLDPNSPTPLTLTANIWGDAQNGTYPVNLVVSYWDSHSEDRELLVPATVVVAKVAKPAVSTVPETGLRAYLQQGWLITIGGAVVAVIAVVVLVYRRRRSSLKTPSVVTEKPAGGG